VVAPSRWARGLCLEGDIQDAGEGLSAKVARGGHFISPQLAEAVTFFMRLDQSPIRVGNDGALNLEIPSVSVRGDKIVGSRRCAGDFLQ